MHGTTNIKFSLTCWVKPFRLSFNVSKFITLEHNPETEFRHRSGSNFPFYLGCPNHTSIVRPPTGCGFLYFPQTIVTNIRMTTYLSRLLSSICRLICNSLIKISCYDALSWLTDILFKKSNNQVRKCLQARKLLRTSLCHVISRFYIYGSVRHNIFCEITNRCSYMQ